jgi:hypothetical protein
MFPIVFFTIAGFLVGLGYVMKRRRIRPGSVLAATFMGLLYVGISRILRDTYKKGKRFYL